MTSRALPPRVIILGATSAIAEATARLYAAESAALLLVARNGAQLDAVAADLRLRGARDVVEMVRDLTDTGDAFAALREWAGRIGGADLVLVCYGTLEADTRDAAAIARTIEVNFTSQAVWSLAAAQLLREQASGTLAVVGSVAGDRGRKSNHLYGAAKAGIGTLVQGIAHSLAGTGARAVLVKPGLVDTPMTAGFRKGPLWARPEQVARVIRARADRGGPIAYAPGFWRWVMAAIRAVPAPIFHRTEL